MQPTGNVGREAAMEAFRRRMGNVPSTAGFPTGGANLSPGATSPQSVMSSRLGDAPQAPQMMSEGGIGQLKQSRPGEAEIIIKALIQRLRQLTPSAPSQSSQ